MAQNEIEAKWREAESSCKSKNRYATKEEAVRVAKFRRAQGWEPERLWCYHCRHCGGFHLTRNPREDLPVA